MDDALTEVDRMVAAHVPFERIEDWIDDLPLLNDDERSALWLVALIESGRDAVLDMARDSFRTATTLNHGLH